MITRKINPWQLLSTFCLLIALIMNVRTEHAQKKALEAAWERNDKVWMQYSFAIDMLNEQQRFIDILMKADLTSLDSAQISYLQFSLLRTKQLIKNIEHYK